LLPLAIEDYRSAVAGFDGKQTEWLRRAILRMIGNIGVVPPQPSMPRLCRGLFGHLRLGHPHRKHPRDPEKKEIERQEHDQARMRSPLVLDEASKKIGDEIAGNHEYQVIDEERHNCLRKRLIS
jgi:hypothetical protein